MELFLVACESGYSILSSSIARKSSCHCKVLLLLHSLPPLTRDVLLNKKEKTLDIYHRNAFKECLCDFQAQAGE